MRRANLLGEQEFNARGQNVETVKVNKQKNAVDIGAKRFYPTNSC